MVPPWMPNHSTLEVLRTDIRQGCVPRWPAGGGRGNSGNSRSSAEILRSYWTDCSIALQKCRGASNESEWENESGLYTPPPPCSGTVNARTRVPLCCTYISVYAPVFSYFPTFWTKTEFWFDIVNKKYLNYTYYHIKMYKQNSQVMVAFNLTKPL
jgi:hypothetical protein